MQDKIKTLQQWIAESDNIVAFTGAGCSTESGVKDFRSPDGLYNENLGTNSPCSTESGIPDFRSVDGLYHLKYEYPPETILSHTFFMAQTAEFFRFYREKMLCLDAEPNAAHKKLAEWEKQGKLRAVITQNIDGLHQKAGSREVLELHGSVLRNYCMRCHKPYPVEEIVDGTGVPHCACGGLIKPDVVLYEESLNTHTLNESLRYIQNTDILIVGGTSLAVYPAAGLLDYYTGHKLVLVNKTPTPADRRADLVIHGAIGEVFSQLP